MVATRLRIGAFSDAPQRLADVDRLKAWTREHFALVADQPVLVSELTCPNPRCPPLQTLIAFWVGEQRHRFKVFKPLDDVRLDDFPPAWLRDSLASEEPGEDECC
jgi:nitrate reductase delta subunit